MVAQSGREPLIGCVMMLCMLVAFTYFAPSGTKRVSLLSTLVGEWTVSATSAAGELSGVLNCTTGGNGSSRICQLYAQPGPGQLDDGEESATHRESVELALTAEHAPNGDSGEWLIEAHVHQDNVQGWGLIAITTRSVLPMLRAGTGRAQLPGLAACRGAGGCGAHFVLHSAVDTHTSWVLSITPQGAGAGGAVTVVGVKNGGPQEAAGMALPMMMMACFFAAPQLGPLLRKMVMPRSASGDS
eukprot:TRINITY_DN61394_c0_g1_i1.p1 TRINITY_DN61394_c0_g1~~TRINITY_DN61394_c0_g1_i1.p1  ORF type:complete len:243 (+),score=56.71 TRINITY_DN61394_c0_g1_i1:123-851(+)